MRKVLALMAFLLAVTCAWAQRTLTGKVTDDKGQPIPNISVIVKGTTVGTVTNNEGDFTLTLPANAQTLVVSGVNFTPKEVSIGSQSRINVSLSASDLSLSEVVVVAYGTAKKSDLTGAVSTIKSKDVENRPFTSVDKALQGQVAGLQSSAASGTPGAAQQIRIRGIGSITGSSEPLWVIDGVPVNTGDVSRLTTTANLLSTLNPNDIESISVLKDASASSIYGSRAANGVILVTTKKGRAGKTKFRFDAEVGQSDIAYTNDLYRPLNAAEYFELTREGLINAGIATPANVDAIMTANFGFGNGVDVNWLDEVTQSAPQMQYNLSASGGNPNSTFFVSGGYFKQEGITLQSDFQRYTTTFRITNKVNERINFNVNGNAGFVKQNAPLAGGAFGNPILSSFFLLPSRAPRLPNGQLNIVAPDFGPGSLHNTVATAELDKRLLKQLSMRGSIGGEYKILKELGFTSNFGVDYNVLEEDQYNNPFHGDGRNTSGRAFAFYTRYFNWAWTNMLNWKRDFLRNDDLTVDLKVGYEAQLSRAYFTSVQSQGFPPTTDLNVPSVGATPITATATGSDYAFASALSLATVGYQDKYILSGSFRRDGSSRFGLDNLYGNFWSVGASWNVDRENFMQNISWINQFKLRASYGVNGNANGIGNYDARTLYGYGFNYNQLPGSAPSNPGNPELTWELNKPLDIGIDLGFFKNRLNVTFDWYKRKTEELLLDAPVSRTTGFTNFTGNIGSMENSGIEFDIKGVPIQTRNFSWDVGFTFAHNENKVTGLYRDRDIPNGVFQIRVGKDIQSFYVRQWAGVDPANGDPLWYVDESKSTTTNSYNTAQRVFFGSASPKYFGGLSNNLNYKGISLEVQFVYNFGNYVRDTWGGFYTGSGSGGAFNKVYRQYAERWRTPGVSAGMPRYVYNGNRQANSFSTFYLAKGDYVRLRNLQLGYEFPASLLSNVKLSSAFFYVRGTNLWTWVSDDKLPFDPEQGVASQTNLNVFIPRVITVGVNLGF